MLAALLRWRRRAAARVADPGKAGSGSSLEKGEVGGG
jgi:hypothetical protein